MYLISFSLYILFSLILTVCDIKKLHVPLFVLIISAASSFVLNLFLSRSLRNEFLFSSFFLFVQFLSVYFISRKRLGPADMIYAFNCGLYLSFVQTYIALTISICSAFIFLVLKRKNKFLPFIPFMFAGTFSTVLYSLLSKRELLLL